MAGDVKRAAGVVGGLTFVSRILGFVRDMFIASYLGAGFFSDAFFVAFRIPNLFRRLFGEGALTVAFVPIFTELLTTRGKEAARLFMRSAFTWLALVLLILVVLGEVFAEPLVWLFAAGFAEDKIALATELLRIVFPYIFFISLVALSMGVLNSVRHFAVPAFSPVLLNLSMVVGLLASAYLPWHPVYCLAVGVLLGGVTQLTIQFLPLAKQGFSYSFHFAKAVPEVKHMGVMMIPSVFGAAAYQINLLINTQLASRLSEGSVSWLYYSDRLIEFPLGVVAVALGTAVLPFLSKHAAEHDFDALKETLLEGLRALYFLLLPAMVGLIVLREPIVDLLFKRQAFFSQDVKMTAYALFFSALGLLGVGTLRVVVPVFYAMKDMWTPFYVSLSALLMNLIFGLLLMGPLKHGGLALAVSISATYNVLMLVFLLRKRIGVIGFKLIGRSFFKMAFASVLMGAGLELLLPFLTYDELNSRLLQLALLLSSVGAATLLYFVCCRLMNVGEVHLLMGQIKKRLLKR